MRAQGITARAMQAGQRGRGGKAGGKEGKRGLGPKAREAIKEARTQASSDPTGAAEEFVKLAEIADGRGMPQVAAFLALQAAELRLTAGDAPAAVETAKKAATLAAGVAQTKRVGRMFHGLLTDLRKADSDAATDLETHVRTALGLKRLPAPGPRSKPNRAQRRALPKACPGCGDALNAKTIEFEDDGTVDCPQCGAAIA